MTARHRHWRRRATTTAPDADRHDGVARSVPEDPESSPDINRAVVLYALARTRWERENGPVLLVAERLWE